MTDVISEIRAARADLRAANVSPEDLPKTPQEAYELALPTVESPAAWKIGGANPWSKKVFGNEDPFFGPLAASEIFFEPAPMPLSGLFHPLAEPEIALEIAEDGADAPFSRMGLSLEIPASVLIDDAKTQLTGQISDRAGAGGLWIGAIRPFDASVFEPEFKTQITVNSDAPLPSSKSNVLFGGPLGSAMRFLELARAQAADIRPGQWIATGGLNPAIPVTPNDRIVFDALGSRITVDFH